MNQNRTKMQAGFNSISIDLVLVWGTILGPVWFHLWFIFYMWCEGAKTQQNATACRREPSNGGLRGLGISKTIFRTVSQWGCNDELESHPKFIPTYPNNGARIAKDNYNHVCFRMAAKGDTVAPTRPQWSEPGSRGGVGERSAKYT